MTERGRPPTTVSRCEELYQLLIACGIPTGARIPRPLWNGYVGKAGRVSSAQVENITRTGEQQGFWERQDSRGRVPGSVTLLTAPV